MTQPTGRNAPQVSLIVPMYNESENVNDTVTTLTDAFTGKGYSYEILLVNDGSTDGTEEVARAIETRREDVRVVSYRPNRGRGYALRAGLASAQGEILVTTEADLSWGTDCLLDLAEKLMSDPGVDVVVASPHGSGGKLEDVPPFRAWVSRTGNRVLSHALPGNLTHMTGMTRSYRRRVIESIDLESDGKEIHIEILSKVFALGFHVTEIPATLSGRRKGRSKFKFAATARSHLLFSFFEKPMLLFGLVGLVCVTLGTVGGLYLSVLRFMGRLTPGRPLFFLVVLLILGGIQFLSFGFVGTQIVALRKEIYRIQQMCRQLSLRFPPEESQKSSRDDGV